MVARAPAVLESPSRMSDEAWVNLPEDEPGELVDGMLVEEEVPDWIHESAVGWLLQMLRAWAVPRGGFVGGSELKYLLGPGSGRKPDLSMVLPGQKPPPRRGAMRRAPDVMIEVVSPRPRDVRRDRIEKLREYAAFGVRWYWLLDPAMRTLEIYELGPNGRYFWALGAEGGRVEAVPGCEGLVLDLDELWAEIDRLGEEDAPAEGEEEG
ncbi:Uma2 family endonuclease [Polyangium aurulentum]|uniref:Uma2 family endonuclease n=1 Tax=Polyangium aurulentum TaxID=2567896 RepID=UPI0010AE20EC|nr:Uma2 family endonuclease [Polyangium aurulentum]UQA54983.1 Uma2 family endonuclease [Polyangium aurulentum]